MTERARTDLFNSLWRESVSTEHQRLVRKHVADQLQRNQRIAEEQVSSSRRGWFSQAFAAGFTLAAASLTGLIVLRKLMPNEEPAGPQNLSANEYVEFSHAITSDSAMPQVLADDRFSFIEHLELLEDLEELEEWNENT